jgi:hypothetical protein
MSDMTQTPPPGETSGESLGETPETDVRASDPNGDGPQGLAGGMGVSSERRRSVRGGPDEVTYTASPTHPDAGDEDPPEGEGFPPEQSAKDGRPEVQPDDVPSHRRNPEGNPGH